MTARDVELAHELSNSMRDAGLRTEPEIATGAPRSVQLLEIGIDALDIAAVRPFWKAVLGYADEAGAGKRREWQTGTPSWECALAGLRPGVDRW